MTTWDERMTRQPPQEPRLELVAPCRRMRGPSGHVLSCAIYRTDVGLEVRAGYANDLLHSQRVFSEEGGFVYAERYREAILGKDRFEELPIGGNANSI